LNEIAPPRQLHRWPSYISMKHSFEYCAMRYLLLWETGEREAHELMKRNPTPAALRKSLQLFRVARTFPGIQDDQKLALILNALRRFSRNGTSSPVENVTALAAQFRSDFDKNNVSAASKLLWLTYRSPYIICDRRAVTGLKLLKPNFKNKDYADYFAAWKTTYAEHESGLFSAAEQLPKLQPFFGSWGETRDSLGSIAKQRWFLERVFDIYLWELGDGQQIVGRERRGRVSHHDWSGEA
jgi:hypothetical protein